MKQTLLAIPLAFSLFAQPVKDFQDVFAVEKKNLGVKGENPYFPLTPGYKLSFRHGKETDTLTVLNETKTIDGVLVRVVEDREEKDNKVIELTLDYYAIDFATNDVYYMGENVDVYKNGKVVGHEGAWLSGVKGAKFGMIMPGKPQAGQKYYQELAPGVGMDRFEIIALDENVTTSAGSFDHCVHVLETSALEKGLKDHKWYAPGVGLVKDGDMVLVQHGK